MLTFPTAVELNLLGRAKRQSRAKMLNVNLKADAWASAFFMPCMGNIT